MGSTNFDQYAKGTDYRALYRQLVDQATSEFGTDAYNGSISTTSGVMLDTTTPMTIEAARDRAGQRCERYDKWGACGAIPILADIKRRTVTTTVTLDGDPADWDQRRQTLHRLAAEKVRLRDGEQVLKVAEDRTSPAPQRFRFRTQATDGKAETRYFVLNEHGQVMADRQPLTGTTARLWSYGHVSQAKARAHADRLARNPRPGAGAAQFSVEGRIRRDSGDPLVTATRELTSAKVPLTVTVGRQTSDRIGGYLFFGMVAM